jgi:hypothetical protein
MITSFQIHYLACDSCWLAFGAGANVAKLEKDACGAGWSMRGMEALCPQCAEDRDAQEAVYAAERAWDKAVSEAKGAPAL